MIDPIHYYVFFIPLSQLFSCGHIWTIMIQWSRWYISIFDGLDNSDFTIDRRLHRSTMWQQVLKKCKIALMRNPYWRFWYQPSWKFALHRGQQSHQHCWFTIWRHGAIKKNYKRNANLHWWEIHIGCLEQIHLKVPIEQRQLWETVGDETKVGVSAKKSSLLHSWHSCGSGALIGINFRPQTAEK